VTDQPGILPPDQRGVVLELPNPTFRRNGATFALMAHAMRRFPASGTVMPVARAVAVPRGVTAHQGAKQRARNLRRIGKPFEAALTEAGVDVAAVKQDIVDALNAPGPLDVLCREMLAK
jgi:hypothetical protein